MKRLLLAVLTAVLVLGVLPVSTFAIEKSDPKFDEFLKGINWSKEDYISFLESKEWYLEDFENVDELGAPLSEEGVQAVLKEFDLTREELNEYLVEYGDIEEGEDVLDGMYIIFNEELQFYIEFYIGTPITPENLQELVEYYEFDSVEDLEDYLNSYGDSIDHYGTIEELDEAIWTYQYGEDIDFDGAFVELGITDEELDRLIAHLETLDFENPEFEAKLEELLQRMDAIEEFETAEELNAAQIAELMDICTDLSALFQLNAEFYLVKGDDKQSLSLYNLITLETVNGYDLLIELYNNEGDFLADLLMTAELFGSEIIKETGSDIKEVEKAVAAAPKVQEKPKMVKSAETVKTVKGAKLPKTASDYAANSMIGLSIALIGFVLFRRFKKAEI